MKYIPLLCILLVSIEIFANTTTPNILFTNITKEAGLPSSSINKVVKDNQGFLWIATSDGLCRYETPDRIKVYQSKGDTLDGIQSNNIHTIYADSKDNIWVGTRQGGLTRFHQPSSTWKTFQHEPGNTNSISHNDILAILEDSKGQIWIGTENGLNLYQPAMETFISFQLNPNQPNALQAKAIVSIVEDDKGWIWLGTWAGGIHLLLPDKNGYVANTQFRNFLPKEDKGTHNVWDICQEKSNQFWLGTHGGGLVKMELPVTATNNPELQDWYPTFYQYQHDPNNSSSLSHTDVRDLQKDKQGRIWVATGNGLNYIEPLLATDTSLHFHRYKHNGYDPNSLLSNYVHTIFLDEQNLLWCGTSGGISVYNPYCNQFSIHKYTQELGEIPFFKNLTINQEKQAWISLGAQGLINYNLESQEIQILKNEKGQPLFRNEKANFLNSENDTIIYIGAPSGIGLVDSKKLTTTFFPFPIILKNTFKNTIIRDIIKDDILGLIWIATDYGLLTLEEQSGKYEHYIVDINNPRSLSDNAITDLLIDTKDALWITTYNGLNRVNLRQNEGPIIFERFHSEAEDISHRTPFNRFTALEEIDNILYIGSTDGLYGYHFDKQQFTNYSALDDKFWIQSLEKTNDKQLWGSTTESLFHFNTLNNSFNIYEKEDGLGDMLFQAQFSSNDKQGTLYFGDNRSIISFNPDQIKNNTLPPPVAITDIKTMSLDSVDIIDAVFLDQIVLDYSVYFFSIQFAALNFSRPEKNKYAYRLEGFEERWNYTSTNSTATYTNLDPGTYTFHVKAANNDGVWNEAGRKITIVKNPAFWQTNWFKVANILLGGILIFVGFRLYANNIQKRNRALQLYNEKLNIEIRERKRIEKEQIDTDKKLRAFNKELIQSNKELEQFAYIASHDLQSPLTSIINFSVLLEKSFSGNLSKRQQEFFQFIVSSTKNMQELVNAILEFSKINNRKISTQQFSLAKLIDVLRIESDAILKNKNAIIIAKNMPSTIHTDRIKLKQILQNLISNGIKFSRIGIPPVIIVSCTKKEDYWLFQVKDNGIGIEKEFTQKVFKLFQRLHAPSEFKGTGIGLALCKKLVEQLGGRIWVESVPNAGSTFYFTIKATPEPIITTELAETQFEL